MPCVVKWEDDDEAEPTLGVREPRRPVPPTLEGGAVAALDYTAEPEAEARAPDTSLTLCGAVSDSAAPRQQT